VAAPAAREVRRSAEGRAPPIFSWQSLSVTRRIRRRPNLFGHPVHMRATRRRGHPPTCPARTCKQYTTFFA